MRHFGTTITETIKGLNEDSHLGSDRSEIKNNKQKAITRIIVTLILSGVAIYLIIGLKKTAEGISLLTLVSGYWLK